jgi:hypothetical protein
MGDSTAQQFFADSDMSWEDNFLKPDYEQIKSNIKNKQSELYYSKLWDRYQQGDSTLTIDEARHIYYGYIFNKDYSSVLRAWDTKETAIHVIAVPTEYDYLFLNNLPIGSQALINGGFDVLYLGENELGIEEMWFDVNQSLNNMFKK